MKRTFFIFLMAACCTSMFGAGGYVNSPVNFHKYSITKNRNSVVLPEKYDSRQEGIVLAARNQGIDGTCWAFANADALQTLFHKKGLTCGYLSPQAFITCFQGYDIEPVKGGGNQQVAGSMIARLEGIVTEEGLSYDYKNTNCQTYSKVYTPAYALGWVFLPENDAEEIKKAIMEYGSVTCSFRYDNLYYNASTNTYKYTGENEPNHGVTLIGWDDTKQAWLCKNTWGTNRFEQGCMWISYQDAYVTSTCVAYTDMTATHAIDHVYHYNTVGMVGGYGTEAAGSEIRCVVKHEVSSKQLLQGIATYNIAPNTKVVYKVWNSQKKLIYESDAVILPYTGFFKYTLPTPIEVEGVTYIAATYSSEEYGYVVPIETSLDSYCNVSLTPRAQWIGFEGYNQYDEFGTDQMPYNFCIYAYTKDATETAIEENEATETVWNGQQLTPSVWGKAKNITLYNIDGKKLYQLTPGETNIPQTQPGIYLLQIIYQDGNIRTEKIKR